MELPSTPPSKIRHIVGLVLAMEKRNAGVRPVQKRNTGSVSERLNGMRNSALRSKALRATGNAGEWCAEPSPYRWNGSGLQLRDRPVERIPHALRNIPEITSSGSANRSANSKTGKRIVRHVPVIQWKRPSINRVPQLPQLRTLQREAECVQRSRCLAQENKNLLLRQRSEQPETRGSFQQRNHVRFSRSFAGFLAPLFFISIIYIAELFS